MVEHHVNPASASGVGVTGGAVGVGLGVGKGVAVGLGAAVAVATTEGVAAALVCAACWLLAIKSTVIPITLISTTATHIEITRTA
jgi:hypothetical protein